VSARRLRWRELVRPASARHAERAGRVGQRTRLSIEAASELVGEFKAGVFLGQPCDGCVTRHLSSKTVGADARGEGWPRRRRSANGSCSSCSTNLEQVVEASVQLASLVEVCPEPPSARDQPPSCSVCGARVEYPVPPLAEPEAVDALSVSGVGSSRTRRPPSSVAALTTSRSPVELAAAPHPVCSPPQQILEPARPASRSAEKAARDAEKARQHTLARDDRVVA